MQILPRYMSQGRGKKRPSEKYPPILFRVVIVIIEQINELFIFCFFKVTKAIRNNENLTVIYRIFY
jgi:hypothetical protein